MADSIPIVLTAQGRVPTPPAVLLAQLIALVSASTPGYTANLPGSLVEDISSTDVGALVIADGAVTETINSLTPFGANAFLLNQLGQIYGVPLGAATNTSVFVIFTGPLGFVIAQGFTLSDGTHQYVVQDGGIIGGSGPSGQSDQLFCLASESGSWAVPAGTVNNLITSVPSTIVLTVTNPQTGTPGLTTETESGFRARVLQAGQAIAQGMASFLKTILGNVPGVQTRLISAQKQTGGGWEIIVGGGDPYAVADAIYTSLFDISTLVGSTLGVANITRAATGVVSTFLNHGLADGQMATVAGAVPSNFNGSGVVTVVDEKSFSIGIDTSGYPAPYGSGGVVSPNPRNIAVTIQDYPDTYVIPYVNPPQQDVAITLLWNTTAVNFTSAAAVAQLGAPGLVDYINSIAVGVPINLYELQAVFQLAVASVLPPQLLTRMDFAVSINGIGTAPDAGTGIIAGDPESFFLTDLTQITITQG